MILNDLGVVPLALVLRGESGSSTHAPLTCNTTSIGIRDDELADPFTSRARAILAVFEVLKLHSLGYVGFVLLLVAWTVAALPLTPLEVCAGYVFGVFWGSIGSQTGKTLGCIISLFIGRHLKASRGWKVPQSLDQYLVPLKKRPFETMCLIRLSPLPLGVKNYGLSLVHFPDDKYPVALYSWAAFLANLPYSIMWSLTGHGAGSLAEAVRKYA